MDLKPRPPPFIFLGFLNCYPSLRTDNKVEPHALHGCVARGTAMLEGGADGELHDGAPSGTGEGP